MHNGNRTDIQERMANVLKDVVEDYIRANREHGMTQDVLSEKMHFTPGNFSNIINNYRNAPAEFIIELMRATGDRRPLELIEHLANLRPQRVTVKDAFHSIRESLQSATEAGNTAIEALEDQRVDSCELQSCQSCITQAVANLHRTLHKLTSLHNAPPNVTRMDTLAATAANGGAR